MGFPGSIAESKAVRRNCKKKETDRQTAQQLNNFSLPKSSLQKEESWEFLKMFQTSGDLRTVQGMPRTDFL